MCRDVVRYYTREGGAGSCLRAPVLVLGVGCRYSVSLMTTPSDSTPSAMDIIYLNELRIDTVIGIFDWERRIKQTISLDLEMGVDIRRAADSDSIGDTLNYKAVAKRLLEFVGESHFQLVETLAERVAAIILTEFDVPWVRLRVNKQGAVRYARDVGVIIERSR